ncbi:MAG: hypothetical protein JWN50_752 [Parcubacteria group bacterium]|nr:hypothetical protein [Parcubacteria group bacterium]
MQNEEQDEEKEIENIEENGLPATPEELDPLEPSTPAGEPSGGTETSIPENTDGLANENTFSSAPATTEDQ